MQVALGYSRLLPLAARCVCHARRGGWGPSPRACPVSPCVCMARTADWQLLCGERHAPALPQRGQRQRHLRAATGSVVLIDECLFKARLESGVGLPFFPCSHRWPALCALRTATRAFCGALSRASAATGCRQAAIDRPGTVNSTPTQSDALPTCRAPLTTSPRPNTRTPQP